MHPCLHCGACCHQHRVAFHWAEADDVTPGGVPLRLVVDHNEELRCMRGTQHGGRCAALRGKIGSCASCSIHPQRPSVCRAFGASFEDGKREHRCDASRKLHGLKPLTMEDWREWQAEVVAEEG